MMATEDLVLVTGGSGSLGTYCVISALNQGYRVRTTVRSLRRAGDVKEMLQHGGVSREQTDTVDFVGAALNDDSGWMDAYKDCRYVLHVASPLLLEVPKDPVDMIKPAREGTLRVLRAAKAGGTVQRVVLTSSMAAISYGHPDQGATLFTEADWSNVSSSGMAEYQISKTLAERAAWDYISTDGGEMELSVINPAGIFGPVLGKDFAASMLYFGIVDVRDVAELHLLAMTDPKAHGQRYIAVADEPAMSMRDVALKMKSMLGSRASKIPTMEVPDFVAWLASWFDKSLALVVAELGVVRNGSNAKAKEVLGWRPRGVDEVLKDAAESLFKFDLVK